MLMRIKNLFLLLCLIYTSCTTAQKFFGSVVLGTNLSQINGDDLAGYDKYGLTGGFRVDYPIKEAVDISAELLFSQRGSKDRKSPLRIDMNYIEIPFLVSYRDWYQERDKYDKVRIEGGFSYGYLFNFESNFKSIDQYLDQIKEHDISFLCGVGYMFTSKVGVSLRYTRALSKLLVNPNLQNGGLLSYFITLRGEYHF
jgi:hypothetical protein